MRFQQWVEAADAQLHAWLNGSTVSGIVYHGTNKPFNQFSYQKSQRFVLFSSFEVEAKGFFFAESPHDALAYGKNVAACYVKMTNPLLDPRRDRHLGVDRLDHAKELHLLKVLGPLIERGEHGPYIDLGVRRVYLQNRRYSSAYEWIYETVGPDGLYWDVLDNPQVVQRMKTLGYDGTFVQEPESQVGRSIFVMNPEQIKIVKWINGPQDHWGDKDDYYTKKIDGKQIFHQPLDK